MAESFTHYFRLMLMHIGLPQWQYAFTDIGLSPQVKQPSRNGSLDGSKVVVVVVKLSQSLHPRGYPFFR